MSSTTAPRTARCAPCALLASRSAVTVRGSPRLGSLPPSARPRLACSPRCGPSSYAAVEEHAIADASSSFSACVPVPRRCLLACDALPVSVLGRHWSAHKVERPTARRTQEGTATSQHRQSMP
eukprot:7144564-Prymnesium_polylepis.3